MEDQITREAAVESARIIDDHQVLLNHKIMMLVITVNWFLAELQKKNNLQRYGKIERIYATEPDLNAPDHPERYSNTADRASQSDFHTPTVTACRPDIKITPPKVEGYGWLLIDVVNKNHVLVIDLNSEEFKQQETPIKFGVRKKQQGPVRYEEEPSIGMILDMYVTFG